LYEAKRNVFRTGVRFPPAPPKELGSIPIVWQGHQ